MAKRIILIMALITCFGCASVNIPSYIQDRNTYDYTLYASFDKSLASTMEALEDLGWEVTKKTDPTVYEKGKELVQDDGKQILLLTAIRQMPFFVGTRYARVNVYLRSLPDNTTEAEIRYLTVTSMAFKSFYKYKNNSEVSRIYNHIEKMLN